MGRAAKLKLAKAKDLIRLDLGCGKNPREGFVGVDVRDFGQPVKADLGKREWVFSGKKPDIGEWCDETEPELGWMLPDGSVEEAHSSHFVEHLTAEQRIHFVNELYRVLRPGGKCQIITPHWASCRAYGDLTHQWPPVSEFWFYYLSKEWRTANAPHNDAYTCDLEVTWGYALREDLMSRNLEYQQFALSNYKEAAMDIIATMTKKV